jgi:hypothetical protein
MPSVEDEFKDLKRQIADLKDEVSRLRGEPHKPVGEPWQPIDYTAGMSMPLAAVLEMARAVPDSVMAGVMGDARRKSNLPAVHPEPKVRGTGWVDEVAKGPPPGIAILDKVMDHQDARDRRERIVGAAIDQVRREAISKAEAASEAPGAPATQPTGSK